MKNTLCLASLITILLLFAACGAEPEATTESSGPAIRGVWTIEEMETGVGDNRRTTVPQAFMLFIGEKYYSAIRDFSPEPREVSGGQPSEGRSPDFIGSFMADAGTYEYDGTNLVVHHLVGMIPSMMNRGSSMTFGCKMEGDSLILTPQYDKMVLPGMNLAPSPEGKMSYGDMAVLYKFRRLE
jgi:hypothetical protein